MRVHPDEAYWNRSHLVDLIFRVHAAAAARGGTARWPTPRSNSSGSYRPGRPGRGEQGSQPVFGGVDDTAAPDGPSASRRERYSLRVHVRGILYANPETPCSVKEVSNVLGLREGDVRRARPDTAQHIGRALMAPFSHWLRSLRQAGLLPTWADDANPHPVAEILRQQARARPRSGQLKPLGGPGQRGNSGRR